MVTEETSSIINTIMSCGLESPQSHNCKLHAVSLRDKNNYLTQLPKLNNIKIRLDSPTANGGYFII